MNDLISRGALIKKMSDTNIEIMFDLPVEELLGEDVDMDDFCTLLQDAIQAYRKLVIGEVINNAPTIEAVPIEAIEALENPYDPIKHNEAFAGFETAKSQLLLMCGKKVEPHKKTVYYTSILNIDKMIGMKDCEIRYVNYEGEFSSLSRMAIQRNITITQLSPDQFRQESREVLRKKVK